jgi:hypothetical protein
MADGWNALLLVAGGTDGVSPLDGLSESHWLGELPPAELASQLLSSKSRAAPMLWVAPPVFRKA